MVYSLGWSSLDRVSCCKAIHIELCIATHPGWSILQVDSISEDCYPSPNQVSGFPIWILTGRVSERVLPRFRGQLS